MITKDNDVNELKEITIKIEVSKSEKTIDGILTIPTYDAKGIVLFAHGNGSGRYSPRNQFVSKILNESNIAKLLSDLLKLLNL